MPESTGEQGRVYYMYSNLAFLAQHAGDARRAMGLARQGLLLAHERNDRAGVADALVTMAGSLDAGAALDHERLRRAVRLLGAAEAEDECMGSFMQPSNTPEYDRILGDVHKRLDDASFQAAWAEGRSMALEQAIAYALDEAEDGFA